MNSGTVPSKYRHQVRIGNWSEEWELEKIRFRDFLASQTKTSVSSQKIAAGHQRASLTFSKDGYLHFGDRVMLYNDHTQGYLVSDTWEKTNNLEEQYALTTTQKTFPCVRSIFVIAPTNEVDARRNPVVTYGQKVRILVNPRMFPSKPLFISSQPADPQRSKKNSRQQDAFLGSRETGESLWVVEHVDPAIRFEMNMHPVQANSGVILRHVNTNQYLASDASVTKTTYGSESEVFAHSFQTHNKTQNLIAEKTGRTTIDIPMRNQHNQNTWVLVTADDPILEFDEASLAHGSDSPAVVLKQLSATLVQKGVFTLRELESTFLEIDEYSTKALDSDNFRWGLRNIGVVLPPDNFEVLLSAFTNKQTSLVDYVALLQNLRNPLTEKRRNLIEKLYQSLQAKLGQVSVESIGKAYKAHNSPAVQRGLKSAKQHFDEFIREWRESNLLKTISQDSFVSFFADVSSLVDNDDQFASLVNQQTWSI